MALLVWDSSYSVGVDVIDGQHKRILEYINQLDSAHKAHSREQVTEVLMGLVDYTETHFTFEEHLMEKAGYPMLSSHKEVHKKFIAHISRFVEQHNEGKDIARRLTIELKIWLINHIKNEDMDYSSYVRKSINHHQGWISKTVKRLFG